MPDPKFSFAGWLLKMWLCGFQGRLANTEPMADVWLLQCGRAKHSNAVSAMGFRLDVACFCASGSGT